MCEIFPLCVGAQPWGLKSLNVTQVLQRGLSSHSYVRTFLAYLFINTLYRDLDQKNSHRLDEFLGSLAWPGG